MLNYVMLMVQNEIKSTQFKNTFIDNYIPISLSGIVYTKRN